MSRKTAVFGEDIPCQKLMIINTPSHRSISLQGISALLSSPPPSSGTLMPRSSCLRRKKSHALLCRPLVHLVSPPQVVPPPLPPDLPPQGTQGQRAHLDWVVVVPGRCCHQPDLLVGLLWKGRDPAQRRAKGPGDVDERDLGDGDGDGCREDLGDLEVEDKGLAEPGAQPAEEGGTGAQGWVSGTWQRLVVKIPCSKCVEGANSAGQVENKLTHESRPKHLGFRKMISSTDVEKRTLTWRRSPVFHAKMVLRSHRGLKYEKTSDTPERGNTQECKARLPTTALEKWPRPLLILYDCDPRHLNPQISHDAIHAHDTSCSLLRASSCARSTSGGWGSSCQSYPSRRADFRTSMLACASEAGSSRIPGRQTELGKVYTPTGYLTWPMVVRFMDGEGKGG